MSRWQHALKSFERGAAQAHDLRMRMHKASGCDPRAIALLDAYDALFRTIRPGAKRLRYFNRLGVRRQDHLTNALLKLMVMFADPKHCSPSNEN